MTYIRDLLKKGKTYSFEFFPPKNDTEQTVLVKTFRELEPLDPSFVSVTYRNGRVSRKRTHDLVAGIRQTTSITPMAHLVCVDHTRLELAEILVELGKASINNLMALAGDPPKDNQIPGELKFAFELVELALSIGGFSIGVAAHTAGHPSSKDLKSDRQFLKHKLDLADFAVTQMFFDTSAYYRLRDDMSKIGSVKPIIPGIMPITSYRSISSMIKMGADIPPQVVNSFEELVSSTEDPIKKDELAQKRGIEFAIEMCSELMENDVPGLHFYTLNRSNATREIYTALGLPNPKS
jgi:methylenetetrahydrofolate reductase (NADPH)